MKRYLSNSKKISNKKSNIETYALQIDNKQIDNMQVNNREIDNKKIDSVQINNKYFENKKIEDLEIDEVQIDEEEQHSNTKILQRDRIQKFVATIFYLIVWEIVAKLINNSIYLPSVEVVIKNLIMIITDKYFLNQIYFSMLRTIISYIIAFGVAIILGVLASMNKNIKNFLEPINALAASMPTMILVVLSLIWFNKNKAPYVVGILIVFPLLYATVVNAVLSIDNNILEMTKIYTVSKKNLIRKIYFPAIKFRVAGMLMSSFSLAFKVVIAGEIFGQPKFGIGTIIQYEKINFNTEAIFAWLVIISLMIFLMNLVQDYIEKK
ncbi:MAG: ABC transporter permease subunit, partial [Clostridioides sp.]|nr:ABC transporter permease subunit [Clostridioides sp.]